MTNDEKPQYGLTVKIEMEKLLQEDKQALCLQCQYCCRILAFPVELSRVIAEFYAARSLPVSFDKNLNRYFVTIPHVCPQLTEAGCVIYAKRPYACRVFDGRTHSATKAHCLWKEENLQ